MYAGAVAVPLIIGRALKLPPEQVAFLISADLFAGGLATLVQSFGLPERRHPAARDDGRDLRLRQPDAVDRAAARDGPAGRLWRGDRGGCCSASSPRLSCGKLLPLFPPVVTGTIILVIGISLMRVGINWAGGGLPTLTKDSRRRSGHACPNPAYGQLQGLGIALFVLIVILALIRWGKGFVANVSVLLGIVAGAVLTTLLGRDEFRQGRHGAGWRDIVVTPFRYGVSEFHLVPHPHDVHRDDRGDDRIARHVSGTWARSPAGRSMGTALTRGLRADGLGTIHRRRLQYIPLHLLFAECRDSSASRACARAG